MHSIDSVVIGRIIDEVAGYTNDHVADRMLNVVEGKHERDEKRAGEKLGRGTYWEGQ
ncbi:MAG: hypothetical protein AAF989_06945 [Planctomycetota bacterium]